MASSRQRPGEEHRTPLALGHRGATGTSTRQAPSRVATGGSGASRPLRFFAGTHHPRLPSALRAIAVVLILGVVLAGTAPVTAQSARSVVWDRFDVTLDLRDDGSYHVVEQQTIRFIGGPFRAGFANIPLARIDAIRGVTVKEQTGSGIEEYRQVSWRAFNDAPGTYAVTATSAELMIQWGFAPATNETRVFLLEYDVYGALRVYLDHDPPNQQIWWTAVDKEVTDVGPVRKATMTINLPRPVADLTQVLLGERADEAPEDHTTDGRTWTWERSDLGKGDAFIVRLQFPPMVNAAPPTWQERDDQQRQKEEQREERAAVLNSIFLGIGLLALVGGGVGLYGLWYTRGRDPHTGAVADFLPQPPDDLPPGAAGTLLDETADERDVVATLIDLARRGVIQLEETRRRTVLGFGGSRDFQITLLQATAPLAPFETELLKALFSGTRTAGQTVKLSEVKPRFTAATPQIKSKLYKELVRRGYFPRSPETTRSAWKTGGTVALIVVIAGGIAGGGALGGIAGLYWLPVVVLAGLALAIIALSSAMPRKTLAGAEAAAKWRAFRRYLSDIEKYEKVAESRDIFEKYLPYAIAFGLERSWVAKFASVEAPAPSWFGPVVIGGPFETEPVPRGRPVRGGGRTVLIPTGGGGGGSQRGGGGGDLPGLPDLQGTSDRAGRSLQRSSDSLLDMFNTAAKIFSGFGGGGSGGGWGGGGGFGGGGSFGGSSGGGGRGFR